MVGGPAYDKSLQEVEYERVPGSDGLEKVDRPQDKLDGVSLEPGHSGRLGDLI